MITVPTRLRETTARVHGAEGVAWCDTLPALVVDYVEKWGLELDLPVGREPWFGFCGIVVPVRDMSGDRAVLKVSWPDEETAHEHVALAAWEGVGAVRLLAADGPKRVLLLERLHGDRDLGDVPVDGAIPVLVDLLEKLAIPAPVEIGILAELATRWVEELPQRWGRTDPPFPKWMLDRAVSIAQDLGPSSTNLLIHTDLHYENVLASLPEHAAERGEWLAIDPKPIAGDPEFGVLLLLWNRLDELDPANRAVDLVRRMHLAAEAAGFDVEKVREWSIVRLVETIIWDAEVGVVEGDHQPGWMVEVLSSASWCLRRGKWSS